MVADSLAAYPAICADVLAYADRGTLPTNTRGRAAFARALLAALAPHLRDEHLRHLAAAVGGYVEGDADIAAVAELHARGRYAGEACIALLLVEALAPTGQWEGIDRLAGAIHTLAAAGAVAVVALSLPVGDVR